MAPLQVMYWLWDAWVLSWLIAAAWRRPTAARPPIGSELWRNVLAFGGWWILIALAAPEDGPQGGAFPRLHQALLAPLWRDPPALGWGCVALTAAGFAFCWWARLHLGPLWSGYAGRKADHRIIDTGPYRLVRHPIYTGILLALLAMALAKGTAAAIIGLALAVAGFALKCRLEEGFLRGELGAEGYDAYARRTPMLVPFIR